jgi:sterol desaturase/sphingolipid hydroxylase (fatty acid hydroxylase superfamily)
MKSVQQLRGSCVYAESEETSKVSLELFKMWVFVFLLNFLGRKNFMRFLGVWMLIMMFFLYCFVHDAFDQPRRPMMVQQMQRRPVKPPPVSAPER